MFSTMYPQGDGGNFRCQYDTRFLSSDKLGHTVCIYSRCLQLLFSVIILQMIVTYFICQKCVEGSLSWQTLGVNRARQVFKLNLLNSNLPTSNLPNLNLPNSNLIQICQIRISKIWIYRIQGHISNVHCLRCISCLIFQQWSRGLKKVEKSKYSQQIQAWSKSPRKLGEKSAGKYIFPRCSYSLGSNRARENRYSRAILIPWGVIDYGKINIPTLFKFIKFEFTKFKFTNYNVHISYFKF